MIKQTDTIFTVTTHGNGTPIVTQWATYEDALQQAKDSTDPLLGHQYQPRIDEVPVYGQAVELADTQALNTEARELALSIVNGNRRDVRDVLEVHDHPTRLVLCIIRHLSHLEGKGELDAVMCLQAMTEMTSL